jgi:peptidoglycan/xylan/chitin deacetylase (PgdA/CDA1 family)
LPTLSPQERKNEIEGSHRALADLVGCPITSFAFPHGQFCPESAESVRRAGFLRACTTKPEPVRHTQDPFQLPRFGVDDIDGSEFGKRIIAWYRAADHSAG